MRIDKTLFAIVFASLLASSAMASSFTGPTSPYYLDDVYNPTIYVVQRASVIYSFPWAYDTNAGGEEVLAVSNTVNTRPFQAGTSDYGGQYTLNGTPTGVKETYPLPAGTYRKLPTMALRMACIITTSKILGSSLPE